MKTLLIAMTLLSLPLTGCWKTYDSQKPDEYYRYWQEDERKKNSVIYPFTNEYNEERRQKR
jgi:hypothetical protein